MKLEPCKTENGRNGRHIWEHQTNRTILSRFADGSVQLTRRGVYQCEACYAIKYGEPRDHAPVIVPAQGVAK